MPEQATHRSMRFIQATKNERRRLTQKRSKISKRRENLQARLDAIDAELEAVNKEIVILDELHIGNSSPTRLELAIGNGSPSGSDQPDQLRGARIREVAIPLLRREQGTAPIHYRAWLELMEAEGYEVAGKRPDAVFLNQVVRSPLVRATTSAGYYQLEPEADQQLRQRLQSQQAELAKLLQEVPDDAASFERQRELQRELKMSIAKTQRELNEALSVIEQWSAAPEPPAIRDAA